MTSLQGNWIHLNTPSPLRRGHTLHTHTMLQSLKKLIRKGTWEKFCPAPSSCFNNPSWQGKIRLPTFNWKPPLLSTSARRTATKWDESRAGAFNKLKLMPALTSHSLRSAHRSVGGEQECCLCIWSSALRRTSVPQLKDEIENTHSDWSTVNYLYNYRRVCPEILYEGWCYRSDFPLMKG